MWYKKTIEEITKELNVDPKIGLTSKDLEERLNKYGKNKLQEKKRKSLFMLFISQLKDVLIYVLLGATLITFIIGEYVDAIIILLVIFINAIVGVIQEYKAEKAIEALNKMTTPKAIVKRNGEISEIDSTEIVPGDIVILDAGRYIPADLRLIESANLQIEESALTGESVPVEKNAEDVFSEENIPLGDRANMAYMSTLVTYGRGEGIVVATGMDTEIGKIAKILDEDTQELTPLQKKLAELGKILGILALLVCVLIFIIAMIQKRDIFEMFLTAISLAVAAIPEGLAAIVAIVLALGVTRMSKINAIVKKLPAVETLGSVNIICSDKTGTLTQNKMTVTKFYTYNNLRDVAQTTKISQDEERMIKSFVLCTDATYEKDNETGDPTEIALLVLGEKYHFNKIELLSEHERVFEKPFDSERKMMSTLNREGNIYRVHTKGAIDNLLNICKFVLINGEITHLTEAIKKAFLQIATDMSNEALRVLAVAFKDTNDKIAADDMEKDLVMLGLVGMIDPPREEVIDSIKKAKLAGITPIMITGDHKNTAYAIAKDLGIASSISQCITGNEIDKINERDFFNEVSNYRVFARVSPEHKVKIVKAFKANGNIVSMTGDGVNDAPSLKIADIGVAMGITGTDVSKGASDMILTDDNFTTIVHAVEEGRNIYNNIKKAVLFLLSCNLGEVVTILVSIILFWPIPLLPTQILWINLITDTLPAIALGIDPGDKDIMKQKPRNPKESFFADYAWLRTILGGVLIGTLTLVAFSIGLKGNNDNLSYARTMAFVVLALSQLFYSLTYRNKEKSIFKIGLFSNKYLIMAILIGIVLQFAIISLPFVANAFKVMSLDFNDWLIVLGLSFIPLLANEALKGIKRIMKK